MHFVGINHFFPGGELHRLQSLLPARLLTLLLIDLFQ